MENQKINKYVSEGFTQVQGWVEPEIFEFLDFLSKHVSRGKGVVEIGIHHGQFFFGLRALLPSPELSVAIDVFEHQQEYNIDQSG